MRTWRTRHGSREAAGRRKISIAVTVPSWIGILESTSIWVSFEHPWKKIREIERGSWD
jgi:hypothetical protein